MLLPVSLQYWLPKDQRLNFVRATVDALDLNHVATVIRVGRRKACRSV